MAATYYVSISQGNDTWAGTAAVPAGGNGPWKTLTRASAAYLPGDRILLRRGDSWNEELHPLGNGTAAEPVVIGAYGEGPRPLIDREDDSKDLIGIHLSDQEGYRIAGIEFARCMTGIYAEYQVGSPTRRHICIEDCLFRDSRMYQPYEDYPAHKVGLGICLFSHECGNTIVLSGITVRNCEFRRLLSGIWTNSPDNFNGAANNIWNFGNLTIEDCLFEEGDQWPLGLRGVAGGTVRNCVTHDTGRRFKSINGVAGAMIFRCRDLVFENCEWGFVSIGEKGNSSGDGEAFDLETNCRNITLRDCLFHDTDGPGILICCYNEDGANTGIIAENCVLNCKAARVGEHGLPKAEIFNNSSYNKAEWRNCRFYLAAKEKAAIAEEGMTFTNCLFRNPGDGRPAPLPVAAATASSSAPGHDAAMAVDGNQATCWKAASGGEQWLQLDFSGPVPIGEFSISEDAGSSIMRYEIRCWDDRTSMWVRCFTGRTIGADFVAAITSRTARKVRLTIMATAGGPPAIAEFRAS